MQNRIDYLDGLRGVAVLLVVSFHAFSRWPELTPYGAKYISLPVISVGWVGVQLFFLISGFVILLSLEKNKSALVFIYKRWLRLFPAMLVCTVLIYFSASFFYERPAGIPSLWSVLPGLTFIEPSWWRAVFGEPSSILEGSFWSLYVEFKFYVFSTIIYFWLGRRALVFSLFLVFSFALLISSANHMYESASLQIIDKVLVTLSFRYFSWFCAGAAFYVYYTTKNIWWLIGAYFCAIFSAIFANENLSYGSAAMGVFVSLLFGVSLVNIKIQSFMSSRFLLFFGFISYPLYLVHENIMISMIVKLSWANEYIPDYFIPVFSIFVLSLAAFVIARVIEPYMRRIIRNFMGILFDVCSKRLFRV